jgi:hypothetical protein
MTLMEPGIFQYGQSPNIFANHLADILQLHNTIFLSENINVIEQFIELSLQISLLSKHFSPAKVQFTISKFPRDKFSGYSLIS